MTLCDYRNHAKQLAVRNNVLLAEIATMPPEFAHALPEIRLINCHPIVDETTYAVVLHEMGHLCHPNGSLSIGDPRNMKEMFVKMEEEDAAWSWAKANACEWTPAMEFVHQWARETYRKHLEMIVKAAIPPRAKKLSEWK